MSKFTTPYRNRYNIPDKSDDRPFKSPYVNTTSNNIVICGMNRNETKKCISKIKKLEDSVDEQ